MKYWQGCFSILARQGWIVSGKRLKPAFSVTCIAIFLHPSLDIVFRPVVWNEPIKTDANRCWFHANEPTSSEIMLVGCDWWIMIRPVCLAVERWMSIESRYARITESWCEPPLPMFWLWDHVHMLSFFLESRWSKSEKRHLTMLPTCLMGLFHLSAVHIYVFHIFTLLDRLSFGCDYTVYMTFIESFSLYRFIASLGLTG